MTLKIYNQNCKTSENVLKSTVFLGGVRGIIEEIGGYDADKICGILKESTRGGMVLEAQKDIILAFLKDKRVKEKGEKILKSLGNAEEWDKLNPFLQKIYGKNGYNEVCHCVGETVQIADLILKKYKGYEKIVIGIVTKDGKYNNIDEDDDLVLELLDDDDELILNVEEENEGLSLEVMEEIEILWNESEKRIFRDETWKKEKFGDGRLYYTHPEGYAIENMKGEQIINSEILDEIEKSIKNEGCVQSDMDALFIEGDKSND